MAESNNKDSIRLQLAELLNKEPVDYAAVQQLSNEFLACDDSQVRFSVDAGIIDRLGNELVANYRTALSELIKNAYDADATKVNVEFIDTDNIHGDLIITDNGSGMSYDTLINGFMRISSSQKVENPISKLYKRNRAGRKGIGRFSVQRLGEVLELETKEKGSDFAYVIKIDWRHYQANIDLESIFHDIEKKEAAIESHGTKLHIKMLRDVWPENDIKDVFSSLSEVILPFSFDEGNQVLPENMDPGMKLITTLNLQGVVKEINPVTHDLLSNALATIDGSVDEDGYATITVNSERTGMNKVLLDLGRDPKKSKSRFAHLRNVHFSVYYFIYDKSLVPHGQLTKLRRLGNRFGGVKLYVNGFRVFPYGSPGNDWLRLDESTRKRVILATHSSNSFVGFVKVNDSKVYLETSSREGIIDSEEFLELRDFVSRGIITAVTRIASKRNVKVVTSQKKLINGDWEPVDVVVKSLFKTVAKVNTSLDSLDDKSVAEVVKIKSGLNKLTEELRTIKRDTKILRVLSSVGLSTAQFVHEVSNYFVSIDLDVRKYKSNELSSNQLVSNLDHNLSVIKDYLGYFEYIVSDSIKTNKDPLDIRAIVNNFIDNVVGGRDSNKLEMLDPVFLKQTLYTVPMNESEWGSILFNFYTNSRKAINRAKVEGKLQIHCDRADGFVILDFSDNGDGIDESIKDEVFNPFFTTSPAKDLDSSEKMNELAGSGLGLAIVNDIVRALKGTVSVADPREGFTTTIRVKIPSYDQNKLIKYLSKDT